MIRTQTKPRPADKIAEGLREALAVAKGEAEPYAVHVRPRGRPASGKVRLTLLVDPATIDRYRATGKGWQARMAEVLSRHAPE